jgi:hypothetical protein
MLNFLIVPFSLPRQTSIVLNFRTLNLIPTDPFSELHSSLRCSLLQQASSSQIPLKRDIYNAQFHNLNPIPADTLLRASLLLKMFP